MKKIQGTPNTIRQLFSGVKYKIHYYQREYQWKRKQIEELIEDLTSEFFNNYTEGENLLARSLNTSCYNNNPQFNRFLVDNNLPFNSIDNFNKEAIRERQSLYSKICSLIWNQELITKL